MEIVETKVKEFNEVVGYKCDCCEKEIEVKPYFSNIELTTINYSHPTGCYGDEQEYKLHVCSKKCLIESLKKVQFDAKVHLSQETIKELIK
jgi:hypothetical protein